MRERRTLASGFSLLLMPLLFYLSCFILLTWSLIKDYSTLFFTYGGGDGLQMIWNIWWVNKAVVGLKQLPWHTTYLHFPHGISLLAHTLHPLKGFIAMALLPFFSLIQVFNFSLVSSFVIGGLTMFWLARHLCRSYWPSLIAGYIFTFSSYHFTHGQGHLQLVSLEWMPLFILLWLMFLEKPSIGLAAGSSFSLFLVILCDYYYFFYCVLAAVFFFLARAWEKRTIMVFAGRRGRYSLALFALMTLLTSGLLAGSLVRLAARDPLSGIHQARFFPLDPFSLMIPGGRWRFADLTAFHWSRLPGTINESSVHLGLGVCILLVLAVVNRRKLKGLGRWWLVLAFFGVMALGQRLNIWGYEISFLPMPYVLLEKLVPPLKMSGVPVRMTVMVIFSAAVIAAHSLRLMLGGSGKSRAAAAVLLLLMVVEYLPGPLPSHFIPPPAYVKTLREAPYGGVYDDHTPVSEALYYQTIHDKPISFGYVSREPLSTRRKDVQLRALYAADDLESLYGIYGFRYLVAPAGREVRAFRQEAELLFSDGRTSLWDLSGKSGR